MHDHENPHAGQGPVLLDIGGEHGALVVTMPPVTEGLEVEIRHMDTTGRRGELGHVAVVARPGPRGPVHTLVYPDLVQGRYALVPLPGDEVAMTAQVDGGRVTHVAWPSSKAV